MKKRYLSYDITRITALLMIVMVHVSAYMVIFFPDTDKAEWAVGNFFNGISRAGVPLFVLLSGALLLNEDKPLNAGKFYKKNLLTMVFLTAGWMTAYGLFYSVFLPVMEGKTVNPADFSGFILRFQGSEYPHLWYMLMLIGMYLMIPVLRLFVKRENKKYITGIIIAAAVIQFGVRTADFLTVNCGMHASAFIAKFYLNPLSGFMGLLLAGWYLNEYKLKRGTGKLLYISGLISVAVGTLVVYGYIDRIPQIRDYMYSELSLPAFLYGTALFAFIRSSCGEKQTGSRLTEAMADCSFGVYLLHVAVLEIFVRLILPYGEFGTGKPLSYIMILYLVTLAIPFAVVKLTGNIKGIRRIFFHR